MRVQVSSLIALGTFLLIFVTVQYAYALPTEQRTDIVFFSEVDNTTEAQPEYVTVITEYNNGTESEVVFETNDVLMERLSRRFPEKASDLEVCLPKVFCGINSNSQSLITHNNYKFQNLLKGLETLSSEEDTADKKSSEASESESVESSEEYGPYTGFRMAKSLSKKSQKDKDKPKKASTPKTKKNSSEQYNDSLYLEKKQRELEQTKDMSAVIQLASEIGHKLRSPRQCRNLFPSCGLSYAQITKLISDTEKPSTTPKPKKASLSNQNKKADIKVKPTVEPPKVEPATEQIPEQPAPPVKGRDGLDTSEEENDDIEYVVDTEIQPMKKYNLFSDNEPDKENSDGHQDELANDEETFTKYANSFPDKKQKPIVDIFGNLKKGKPGTKPGKDDKLAQKKLENKNPSDSSEEDDEETPESSAEAQKYSYRSETPYSNGQPPHYPAQQGFSGPGHGGPGHGGPGYGGPGHGRPVHGGPGHGIGHGAPGHGGPEPMPGNGGMYPHNQQRPLGPGPYYDEPQSNEDEEENDEALTRVAKSKKNGQHPTPYGGPPVQHPGPASSEEDSGEGDKSAEVAPSAAPFSPVAGAYSNQNPTYAHSPYQPFGGPSGGVKPPTPPPGQPGEPQTFDEEGSLEEDEEEEADEPEPEEEVKFVKNKKNDNKSKSKSDVKKNVGKKPNKKDQKKNTKNGSSEERSLEADPYIKAHEVAPPKPEPPGLFTRFFNSFSGPEGSEEGPAGPRPTNGYGNGPGPTSGYGNRPGPGFNGNPQGYGGRPQGFGNRPEGPQGPQGPTRSGYDGEEANDDEPDNEGEEHSSEEEEEDDEDQDEENDEDNDEEEEKPKQTPNQKKNQKQNKNKDQEQDEEHDPDNEHQNDEEPKREQPPLPEVVVPENEETDPPLSESPFPPNPDADSIATPSIGNNKTNKKYTKKANKKPATKKPVQLMDTKDLSSEENKSEYEEDDIDSSKQVTGNGNAIKKNANSNQALRPSEPSSMQDNNGSAASDKSEEGSIMDDFDKIASSFTTSADKPSEWSDEEAVKNIKVPELKTPPRKYVVKKKSLKKKQAVRAHHQVQSKSKVTTANTSKDYSSEEDDER